MHRERPLYTTIILDGNFYILQGVVLGVFGGSNQVGLKITGEGLASRLGYIP